MGTPLIAGTRFSPAPEQRQIAATRFSILGVNRRTRARCWYAVPMLQGRRRVFVLLSATLSLALGCGERSIAADGGEEGTGETGTELEPLSCEGPDAPSEPVLLVEGGMQPGPFVRVGDRVYWADAWDEWADEQPSVTLYRAQLEQPEDWVPVAIEQPGINQIVSDGEHVYWIVEGLAQPDGKLLRAGPDDAIEVLDEGLYGPRALTLGDGGEWVYYADGGGLAEPGARILRVRPDGADKQVLAESHGQVTDIAVDGEHVWWTIPFKGEVWRIGKAGGSPELVGADIVQPEQVETNAGFAWTLSLTGLYRIKAGAPPYFINGHIGPFELAVTETHLYLAQHNELEDPHFGSVNRYPLMGGEYDPLVGEFVIDELDPKPSTVRTGSGAIYWATADEEAGEGAIWMLCESAL